MVLKLSWQEDSRKGIELSKTSGEFGIATLATSWEAVYDVNDKIVTYLYLPEDENEAAKCHSNTFKRGCPVPEPRCFNCRLIKTEGESLVTARSIWRLFEAILHSILCTVSCFLFDMVVNAQF